MNTYIMLEVIASIEEAEEVAAQVVDQLNGDVVEVLNYLVS